MNDASMDLGLATCTVGKTFNKRPYSPPLLPAPGTVSTPKCEKSIGNYSVSSRHALRLVDSCGWRNLTEKLWQSRIVSKARQMSDEPLRSIAREFVNTEKQNRSHDCRGKTHDGYIALTWCLFLGFSATIASWRGCSSRARARKLVGDLPPVPQRDVQGWSMS